MHNKICILENICYIHIVYSVRLVTKYFLHIFYSMMSILLEANANTETESSTGKTAIMFAAFKVSSFVLNENLQLI